MRFAIIRSILVGVALVTILGGCTKDPTFSSVVTTEPVIQYNPSGYNPLAASIELTTSEPFSIEIRVKGRHGAQSDVIKRFNSASTELDLPILGLYPNFANQIEVVFYTAQGDSIESRNLTIRAQGLPLDKPEVTIDQLEPGRPVEGFNLVNYFGHNGSFLPQRPLMFDAFGDIRWYLDFTSHPILSNLFYDNGLIELQNGNLAFGDGTSDAIYEIDRLGNILNTWDLMGFGFHHHLLEKPNGNFLVTVNDNSLPTVEDVIIEIDRNSRQIINTWDLNTSLDNRRRTWDTDIADLNVDWFHANGLAYDERDNTIIVSGRTQGTVKLTANNEVVWILAPHKGWATAGNGEDLNQFLLQPLDAGGQPISDQAILDGDINHPDFEWSWYQHAPILLPNGNLMLFDNGENRNFTGTSLYSRAVEYEIDDANRTLRQVWSYGKDRRQELYLRIVSKVAFYSSKSHVLFTPGAIRFGGPTGSDNFGKVIEVDRTTSEVVFEASVMAPIAPFNITFHNAIRVPLYTR